ncbi:DUF1398 domain-containing protein [Dyella monticola]|uniref:DUF1398 domain-containing protein n=1 Tax=Dyella monticola TaxID=1927958 RepID=A0A370X1R0_9GAMM|nr:DUF1398 domain-containing protein [Dyella monticola]RDS82292.1 DUF1398 domain-containing protein [Dyella monticola]
MNEEQVSSAQTCLHGAHDGALTFPQILGLLHTAGFEGYAVDYRRNVQTYYLPDGDSVTLEMPSESGAVAAAFEAAQIEALVRWAQKNGPDYSYKGFCERVRAAGCAGYLVSILGRRAVYFGRTAETHIELFPS